MNDRLLFQIIFTGTWALVGVVFLAVGLGLRAARHRREERMRARAAGRVEEGVRRNDVEYPVVRYEVEGRVYTCVSSVGSSRRRYEPGQEVDVLYDPDDPGRAVIDGDDVSRLLENIFLAVGAVCVAVGVIVGALAGNGFAFLRALHEEGYTVVGALMGNGLN